MGSSGQVPAVVAAGLICLAVGAGGAVLTMMIMGYEKKAGEPTPEQIQAQALEMKGKGEDPQAVLRSGGMMGGQGGMAGAKGGMAGAKGGMMGDMGGKGGMMGGKGGGMGKGGGGFGPTPKTQLAQLVAKLDVLTAKPLSIELTDDQRAKVREQIKGLASNEELSDDEATKRLNALLDVLKEQKVTLEAAGYRWPGEGGGGFGGFGTPQPANPFKEGKDAEHLKDLDERLAKKK
jgi:hypothetical protein